MKIALTVKGAGLGAWLDDSFASCNQVMIVEDNNRFTAWLNPFHDDLSAPALLADAIIKENVDVLITSQISAEAASKISIAGINLVTKNGGTVFDLIDEVRGE